MSRGRLIGIVVIGALLCVWSAQGYAADITIDNFEEGSADMVANSTTTNATDTTSGLSTTNVIGGERHSSVTWESGTPEDITLKINQNSNKQTDYASDPGYNGYFELTYGNSSFLDADLTDSGSNNCFGLLFDFADLEGDILLYRHDGEQSNQHSQREDSKGSGDRKSG